MLQLRTTMFSLGRAQRRPSTLRPDLIAIQSSPVLKVQSSISTFLQDSGSQPSPLGPLLSTVTPRTVRSSQRSGWMTQNGERSRVTPSIRTVLHSVKFTVCGRKVFSGVVTRSYTGRDASPHFSSSRREGLMNSAVSSSFR